MNTERLFLRKFELMDAEALYRLNADPEVLRYTGDDPFGSVEEARSFIRNYDAYRRQGFGRWAVICKETNQFVGWCGLKRNEENLVDIGFRFLRNEWGKGYATESALAVISAGFETFGLDEIIGRTSRLNLASVRVLEKLNMRFWKSGECQGIKEAVYYRITRDEYPDQRDPERVED